MAGKKSSKHWQNFYNTIQDLQIKCSLSNDIITPEIAKYFEQTFFDRKFYLIAAKAMTEIEHKTKLGLKGIAIDCKAFDLRFKDIKSKNKKLLEPVGISVFENLFREDGQLFSGLRTSEKGANYAYYCYTNIESTFYNFYNRFKEITGISGERVTEIKPATMLEPITEEKLKEYGFDDLMIERLKTWEDYECKITNGTDFICASNITGIIYTGEHGYDKFHNIGIDRFKTFDSMFDTAYAMETVTIEYKAGLSNSYKAAIYKVERQLYEGQFQEWLHKFKGLKRLTDELHYEQYDKQYTELLTKNNFLEFLNYKLNKEREQQKRHEADKESWQITIREPETKSANPSQRIYYPNELGGVDTMVLVVKEQWQVQINNALPDKVLEELNNLPDVLKSRLAKAKNEIPETCKRMLADIRHTALQWYTLDHIDNSQCNMMLYRIKKELKWYVDETARVYDSLGKETIPQVITKQPTIEIRPYLKAGVMQTVYDLLKDFFSNEDQTTLFEILQSGGNTNKPLLFRHNGNRLADAFKQLIENDLIIGMNKQDLEVWLSKNFEFLHNKSVKQYTPDYIEKCISRHYYPCKKPLFKVIKGEVVKNT